MVVKQGIEQDQENRNLGKLLAAAISEICFNGAQVDTHFCDENLETLIVLPMARLSNAEKEYLRESVSNSNQTTDLYEENNTATDNLRRKDLDASFQLFFENFTKDRKTQLSLINTPLPDVWFNYEYVDENDQYVTEYLDKRYLEENWKFLDKNFFIETGIRNVESLSRYGIWSVNTSEGTIMYSNGIPETCDVTTYVFSKTNEKWCLLRLTH